MKKKLFSLLLVTCFFEVIICGCSNKGSSETLSTVSSSEISESTESVSESMAEDDVYEEDGEFLEYYDPYALQGEYQDKVSERATMTITFMESSEEYEIFILWSNSASSVRQWNMLAKDTGELAISYDNCICDDVFYADDGTIKSIENVYENGKGSITVNDDNTISWVDDNGEEHIFEKIPN